MKYRDIVSLLQAEMDDAETSIEDIEDNIASFQEDIYDMEIDVAFSNGRRCLACSLLHCLEEKQIEDVL